MFTFWWVFWCAYFHALSVPEKRYPYGTILHQGIPVNKLPESYRHYYGFEGFEEE